MSLKNKSVIVTGAGSGIGFATASLLAEDGAQVIIAEINPETGKAAERDIRDRGGKAQFIQTDVSDEASVDRMVENAVASCESISGLVNNAGIDVSSDVVSMSLATWDRVLSVNLRSVFLCCRAALPSLRQVGGAIVNIASVHAQFAFEGYAAYDASKGGIVSMTRTIALENGKAGVRANSISPGYIDTPMGLTWLAAQANPEALDREIHSWHPLGRRGLPTDVAKAVRFLLSDDSGWITGANLVVDGGLSVRFFGG